MFLRNEGERRRIIKPAAISFYRWLRRIRRRCLWITLTSGRVCTGSWTLAGAWRANSLSWLWDRCRPIIMRFAGLSREISRGLAHGRKLVKLLHCESLFSFFLFTSISEDGRGGGCARGRAVTRNFWKCCAHLYSGAYTPVHARVLYETCSEQRSWSLRLRRSA